MDNQTISSGLTNLSDNETISRFADSLIQDKGLGGLEETKKAELKSAIIERLTDTINQALIYALPDDKFEELEKLADSEGTKVEQVAELIANSGIDTQAIVTETMDKFRRIFLDKNVKGEA